VYPPIHLTPEQSPSNARAEPEAGTPAHLPGTPVHFSHPLSPAKFVPTPDEQGDIMGRRDEYDDDEDDRGRRPAKRGGVPPALVVLLAIGGGFLFLAIAVGVGALMLAGRTVETRPTQTEPANKLYTRDEFRKLLMGKTAEEVIQLIGKPKSTSDTPDRNPMWLYRGITYDPLAKNTDISTYVYFRRGVVDDIRF
jgi:hypothetical protein